ncbi:hypothetical protein B0H15DRAFT_805487 [Mycena belliarum]|uniref:Uncharacterized protein n=1 Tax=Mycena belliarum TaxID=1033014 RepID=A0AAD6TRA0_9AGAR|nr:hypothetical protein B0H15DRAFT_805487 [Mycena belliae]
MPYDGLREDVIREAGRAVAASIAGPRDGRRNYDYDDYDRRRSRSPRPYSSSDSSYGRTTPDSGSSSYGWRARSPAYSHDGWDPRRAPENFAPRGTRHWDRRRSPSPPRRSNGRYQDERRYPEHRRSDHRRGHHRGRGRPHHRPDAQEETLRRRALESRTDVSYSHPLPNIMAVPRDNHGHPLFPEHVREDGEDDDEVDGIREPRNYATNETIRRTQAVADENNGKVYGKVLPTLDAQRVGPWSVAGPILTFVQAVNILRWVHNGDRFTMEFLRSTQTRLGTDPTLPRSQGEVTLLQHQQGAMNSYKALVNGGKIPRHKMTNAGRAGAPFQAPRGPVPMEEDEPMPQVPEAAGLDGALESGAQPLLDAFTRQGMSAPLAQARAWYAAIPTTHWPRGMRAVATALPETLNEVPFEDDVRAWFTLNALAPQRETAGTSLHRARFMDAAIRLLSAYGTYHRYAQMGGYPEASLPLEHYPFDATNISFAHIVAWMVQHGLTMDSEGVAGLESFARSRRNHTAGVEDLNATSFADGKFPAGLSEVAAIVIRDEDLWANLRHSGVREGISTQYPVFPAAPADVEMTPLPPQTSQELRELGAAA